MPDDNAGRVLVVDDERDIGRAFSRILTRDKYEVEAATSGHAAIERIRQVRFDVVLTDLAMPGMDGISLLKAIREYDLDLPVVVITAAPSVQTAMAAIEHGAIRYLEKPVPLEQLLSTVSYAVAVGRSTRLKRLVLEESGAILQQINDRAGLAVKFESALQKLWMAYQPIVRYSTRDVFAHEALVRSREPAVPHPGALFDAAEKLNRVQDVGRIVRSLAPNPLATAPERSLLFVNLHTDDLNDPQLYDTSAPLVAAASRTVLEITERASLDAVKDIRSRIADLRRLGFRIALDDIGAGYAGLSSFATIEPDVVKIDMSLVRGVHQSPTKQRLITSLVSLCAGMNKLVVAEGVETVDELATLIGLGCDLFQGYLFAKPDVAFPTVRWPEAATQAA